MDHIVKVSKETKEQFRKEIITKNNKIDNWEKELITDITKLLYEISYPMDERHNTLCKGGVCKMGDILKALGLNMSGPYFRKLIQIYREHPEMFNPKSVGGNPLSGFIIADRYGYKYERVDYKKIEVYLNSLDERRRSLNKQILAAEAQIENIKESNLLMIDKKQSHIN